MRADMDLTDIIEQSMAVRRLPERNISPEELGVKMFTEVDEMKLNEGWRITHLST